MLKLLLIGLLCDGYGFPGNIIHLLCTTNDGPSASGPVVRFGTSSHVQRSPGDQGIEGIVFVAGGNLMPAPNRKPSSSKNGIRATIYIYELTNISQVDRVGQAPYYKAIHTRLIQQADTDDKGHFKVLLPVGRYSIFTRKGDLFYASRRDEKNNIAPVEVSPGKITKVECSVESDHKPVY